MRGGDSIRRLGARKPRPRFVCLSSDGYYAELGVAFWILWP